MIIRKIITLLLCVILMMTEVYANPNNNIIRLAILDSPKLTATDSAFSADLQNSYMQGISAAIESARLKGYVIEFKTFFYGNNLLDIINKIPDVKAWHPDVIIGLHSSNQFLITRNYFDNLMVISLFATDINIKNMADNFYSLGIPDQFAVESIPKFIEERFPGKNIFLAIEADSKESTDLAQLIQLTIKNRNPKTSVIASKFIKDDIDILDISTFLANYKKGDVIIILADTYYLTAELMSKISKHLAPNPITFVTCSDNWGNEKVPTEKLYPFEGYRMSPYVMKYMVKDADFYTTFLKINNAHAQNLISYTTYNAVMSFIQALQKYSPNKNMPIREKLLYSYKKAIRINPNWYRPDNVHVYFMTPGQEELLSYSYPLINHSNHN